MPAKRPSIWRKRIAVLILLSLAAGSTVAAQPIKGTKSNLETILTPGRTIWITDTTGREKRTRVVGLSDGILTTTSEEGIRHVPASDVMRIRVRKTDGVMNGALVGAGAAVASGLFVCRMTEPWENCRDDVGPMLRIGAVGAAIGAGVDALIRGRKTIYDAAQGSARLYATPIIARHAGGIQVSLRF